MKVILLFIDGVGLGDDAPYNPFYAFAFPFLDSVLQGGKLTKKLGPYQRGDVWVIPTDATLGVAGVPQSATGQATIFTGRNAPAFVGEHQSGFPFKRLREWIKRDTIYSQVYRRGMTAAFANAYSQEYFARKTTKRGWMSVTTVAMLSARLRIRMLEDLLAGDAVFHDLTRESLQERYPDIPPVEPEDAARDLLRIASRHHLTVHEYFLTDVAGHKQDPGFARRVLADYDRFLAALYRNKPDDVTILLCSDHGNCEDLRAKGHTRNDVPTIIFGRRGERVAGRIRSLVDIAPAVLTLLETTGR
ncbi:metalloenzyme [Bacillaceae bacterium]